MTFPQIAKIAFMITAVLLWMPVAMMKQHGGHLCLSDELSVSVLRSPPFTTVSDSGEVEGLLGEFFSQLVQRCLNRNPCEHPSNVINTTIVNSTEDFISTIRGNKTDIAFPISKPIKMLLSADDPDSDKETPPLMFELFITSPGYLLIMDVGHINHRIIKLELKSLFENCWPMVAFTLLIAGISGMVVWILVSRTSYSPIMPFLNECCKTKVRRPSSEPIKTRRKCM